VCFSGLFKVKSINDDYFLTENHKYAGTRAANQASSYGLYLQKVVFRVTVNELK